MFLCNTRPWPATDPEERNSTLKSAETTSHQKVNHWPAGRQEEESCQKTWDDKIHAHNCSENNPLLGLNCDWSPAFNMIWTKNNWRGCKTTLNLLGVGPWSTKSSLDDCEEPHAGAKCCQWAALRERIMNGGKHRYKSLKHSSLKAPHTARLQTFLTQVSKQEEWQQTVMWIVGV